jgi:methylthioxylose transferase
VLMGPVALGVLVAARQWRPLLPAALAALVVVGAFALAGFWWYEAQQLLVTRYYEGKGLDRQFGYWWWGNLAAAAVALGPAVWAAGGAAVARLGQDPSAAVRGRSAAGWLAAGAAGAIAAADLSQLSKSEVERIWLPFLVWLVPLTAGLRAGHLRSWLALQAAWALGVCIAFRTTW